MLKMLFIVLNKMDILFFICQPYQCGTSEASLDEDGVDVGEGRVGAAG